MYAALTTARLGLRTAAVVGVDTEAADAAELTMLGEAGVDILRVDLSEGPIYHNVETTNGSCADVRPARGSAAPGGPAAGVDGCARLVGRARWPARSATTGRGSSPRTRMSRSRGRGSCATCAPASRCADCAPRPSPILERADLIGVSRHDVRARCPAAGPRATAGPGGRPAGHRGRRGRSPDPARPGSTRRRCCATARRPAATKSIPPGQGTRSSPRSTPPGSGRAPRARGATARRCAGRSATGWTCGSRRPQDRWSWRIGVWMACRTWRPSRPVLERDAAPGTVIAIPTEDAIRFWSEGPPAA